MTESGLDAMGLLGSRQRSLSRLLIRLGGGPLLLHPTTYC